MSSSLEQLLRVAAIPYRAVTHVRNIFYDKGVLPTYQVQIPTISIGNLTAGGNGKTPLCIFLALELAAAGSAPVVLSRGYGGKAKGPLLVTLEHSAREVGDEPLLIARKTQCPVVVARNRVAGAEFILRQKLGNIIVLDDAFQHRRLRRNVDIVCVDVSTQKAVDTFVGGDLLPRGRFREDRDRALARAHMVILMRRAIAAVAPVSYNAVRALLPSHVKVHEGVLEAIGTRSLRDGFNLSPRPVVAFCAIANPSGFFQSLEALGYEIVESYQFSDHYCFSASEIAGMQRRHPGVPLVCTEKDAVKLRGVVECVFVLEVRLRITDSSALMGALTIGRQS